MSHMKAKGTVCDSETEARAVYLHRRGTILKVPQILELDRLG